MTNIRGSAHGPLRRSEITAGEAKESILGDARRLEEAVEKIVTNRMQKAHVPGAVVTNVVGIGLPEKEKLSKQMQKTCGTGVTVKEGRIEIQGDKREEVARILADGGFEPVFAGG